MSIKQNELLYSGKTKSLFQSSKKDCLVVSFRNDTTAFDGEKHEQLDNKGKIINTINSYIMQVLQKSGIPTHFVKKLSPTESLVKHLKMIPLESVARNISAGSICRRLGVPANAQFDPALYELFLKNDKLHDPLVNENHAISFNWATEEQLIEMKRLTLKINKILSNIFSEVGLLLVDGKYEFGIASDNKIYLGDEITPDSCRIWDKKTLKSLDKDRFRKGLGDVVSSYEYIADLLKIRD